MIVQLYGLPWTREKYLLIITPKTAKEFK